MQRVAIKKQFFLAALQIIPPPTYSSDTPTSTQSPAGVSSSELSQASGFSRISVVLAAPATRDQPGTSTAQAPAPASANSEKGEEHVATDENMRVFLELKANVPLQFGDAHAVNTTRFETHTLMVRRCQASPNCQTIKFKKWLCAGSDH